jgi:hypothetical protein
MERELKKPTVSFQIPPHRPEGVEKLLHVERSGRDIEKVLERYLFGLTTYNEKRQ